MRPDVRGERSPEPRPSLSVVVPTLDEAECLPALLGDLRGVGATHVELEVVVADGGSADGTPGIARALGARVVRAPAGRGRQLRAGADAARGAWLFFVHADCRLDRAAIEALRDFLRRAGDAEFAHFRFRLDGDRWIHRFIEFGQGLRERWLGLVYGDQGLVVSRALHDRVGGFPDWPLMEDVEMIRRLEREGRRVALDATLLTSARRYDEEGGLRRWTRNVALMSAYRLGVPPRSLARWYRPRPARRPRRIVAVLAKAPEPGRVKTRLAADVGDARATKIYRALGRAAVDALRGGAHRTIVYVDPPDDDALDCARAWLGPEGVEYRPQSGGDLGARMSAALEECLAVADEALLVGADIPGIDRETVEAAFAALHGHDAVIGPAIDGGYYLLGAARPHPELFTGIEWSTERVLAQTLARTAELGLSVALLEAKTDVDTLADVPPELLEAGPGRA